MIVQATKIDLGRAAMASTANHGGGRWPGDTDGITRPYLAVPYRFGENPDMTPEMHTPDERDIIRVSMNKASNEYMNGCIQFVDDSETQAHESYIEIFNGDACNSALGWSYPYDNGMNLSPEGNPSCLNLRTIQHEFLHALGFLHEQVRPDRDDYIDIHEDNIDGGMISQYEIMPLSTWMDSNSPYDKISVMHYSGSGYAKGKSPMTDKVTGEAVQSPDRPRMSSEDAFQLAAMYGSFCPALPQRACDDGQRYLKNFAWYCIFRFKLQKHFNF